MNLSHIPSNSTLDSVWDLIVQKMPAGWSNLPKELMLLVVFGVVGIILRVILRYILRRVRIKLNRPNTPTWLIIVLDKKALKHLVRILPPLVLQLTIISFQYFTTPIWNPLQNLLIGYIVFRVVMVLLAWLDALMNRQIAKDTASVKQKIAIKSYIQLAKLLIIFAGVIIMIAALFNRSPLLLLSSLGALSAVLMLIFKDTILSFTAGVQLASTDTLRVGDWIEMKSVGANGFVKDMSLHFVSVQNWDKTITTMPTWRLVADSYQNWRGVQEAGARLIQFSILFDVLSIKILSKDDFEKIQLNLSIPENILFSETQSPLTNLNAYRLYVEYYLKHHSEIRQDTWLYASIEEPSPSGVPLQITTYTNITELTEYARIKSEVLGHLMAVVATFDLSIFQAPSGHDMRCLSSGKKVTTN